MSENNKCWCYECIKKEMAHVDSALSFQGIPMYMTKMILCPICGNKRCPHATDHNLECTNSNAPGQKGSRYQ